MVVASESESFAERLSPGPNIAGLLMDRRPSEIEEPFTERIQANDIPAKLRLIQKWRAEGRLHYRPLNFEIVRRLSAFVMFNPQMAQDLKTALDEEQEIPKNLRFLLEDAIHFSGGIEDSRILNALWRLNPNSLNENHGTPIYEIIGLYLALASKVSIHPKINDDGKSKSFLEASHDNNFICDIAKPVPPNLKEAFINTLKDLGLYEFQEIRDLVEEWCTKGTYKIDNQPHIQTGRGGVVGIFNKFAKRICRLHNSQYAEINSVIAFALSLKDVFKDFAKEDNPDAAACAYLKDLLKDTPENKAEIEAIIEDGNKIRFDELCKAIIEHFQDRKTLIFPEESVSFLDEVLLGLPLATLEILDTEHINIAYAYFSNISGLYPKTKVPGFDVKECDKTRFSAGVMLGQFYTMMVSNGEPADFKKQPNAANGLSEWKYNAIKAREFLAHESVHLMLNHREFVLNDAYLSGKRADGNNHDVGMHLPNSRIGEMKTRLIEICQRLQSDECAPYLNRYTILDPNLTVRRILSPVVIEGVKYDSRLWSEEVMANLWALMNGEESLESRPLDNLLHSVSGNDEQVPQAIRDLREYCRDFRVLMNDLSEKITQGNLQKLSLSERAAIQEDDGVELVA